MKSTGDMDNSILIAGGMLEVYECIPWEFANGDSVLSLVGENKKTFIRPSDIIRAKDVDVIDGWTDRKTKEPSKKACCKLIMRYGVEYYIPCYWIEVAKSLDTKEHNKFYCTN